MDTEEVEKTLDESPRLSPTPKDSVEGLLQDSRPPNQNRSPQRQPSKLQKQPPPTSPPKTSPTKDAQQSITSPQGSDSSYTMVQSSSAGSSTLRRVTSETQSVEEPAPLNIRTSTPKDRAPSPQEEQRSAVSPFRSAMKPEKTEPAAQPTSSPIDKAANMISGHGQNPFASESEPESEDDIPQSKEQASQSGPNPNSERLSESPVQVSPIESSAPNRFPSKSTSKPPLMLDTSSSEPQSTAQNSPSVSTSSASLVEAETPRDNDQLTDRTTTSPHADAATPSTTRSTPSWSDASLRTYMEDDSDIRDLLIIVHDKSNVVPAGPDHPVTGNLFNAEKTRLAEMQSNLDSMLTGWLARKSRSQVSSTA